MLIEGMAIPPARNRGKSSREQYRCDDLKVPFEDMKVGDAYLVDMEGCTSSNPYNLLKQRVYRASQGKKKFVSRKVDGLVYVFRTT